MPEYHPGTDVEIPDHVPGSAFRNAIPNKKRYMKINNKTIQDVCKAAHEGHFDLLEELLSSGDEATLFNGDLNEHSGNMTALQRAAMSGQSECVELLLQAKADPHMRESMPYGKDPEDGKTALELAKDYGWGDTADLLQEAQKKTPYGYYVPEGKTNNSKQYGCWEWGSKKPDRGWYMGRPGAAKRNGLDPAKYGDVEAESEEEEMPAMSAMPSEPALPLGLLFPGQGSQYPKMMSVVKNLPAVKDMLEKAEDILGFDVLDLCTNGPESKLDQQKYNQPVMFIAGLAGLEKLRQEREEAAERPQVVAGLSIGEYTALCAAGVFTFEDGLKLVKARAEAMEECTKGGQTLSVAGIDKEKLESLCADAKKKAGGNATCQISNELFPKGFSCAGSESAITELKKLAETGGALQAKVLKNPGGFHTALMEPAKAKLSAALDEILPRMKGPKTSVFMNCTGQPVRAGTHPKVIVDLMKRQLTNRVFWEESVKGMIKDGVTEFYEVGPMKQLKAMMKRIDSKAWGTTQNVDV